MPRAVDPGLFGKQLKVDHSPLGRIAYTARKPPFDLEAFRAQVVTFIEDFLFPAIEDLTGIDLSIFLPLFTGLDFSSPEAFFTSLIDAILATGAALLGPDSPLNALNLFNLVPTDLLAQISASSIGTAITNLVTDGNFLDTSVIEGWVHDLTGGFGGTGSRTATANGTTQELLGNLIPVSKDQVVPITGKAKWAGLAGTGNPIALAVTGYNDAGGVTTQQTVASHNTTPATSDWVDLAGSFTVPDNVSSLRTRLVVGAGATAGTVSFSKISGTKVGPMLQRLIAGTDAGTFLPDDITNLFSGITTNALALLQKAGLTDFNDLVSTIGGDLGTDITAAEARLASFLDSLSPLNADQINTGSIADQYVPGVGEIVTNIFAKLFGVSATSATQDDAASALEANAHALTDHGAAVTNMFARLSNLESKVSALPVVGGGTGLGTADGGAVGVTDTDTFERTSSTSLGSLWLTTYQGGAGVWATFNGHDAEFAASGVDTREFLCIRNNPAILRSQTDYQRVTSELSSRATRYYDPLFGAFNFTGHDDIWLRVSDATTSLANITGTRIRWGGDGSLSIVRFVNGAPTTLDSKNVGFIVPPGPGANLIGEAGVLADGAARTFRAKIGGSIRLQVTEIGTASGLGAACRRWGHGGRAEGHLLPLPGQERPGGLHYWNGMDQTL